MNMIYQPRGIQPIHKSIDGNQNNEISMIMNTTDYVSAYRLTIYNVIGEANEIKRFI